MKERREYLEERERTLTTANKAASELAELTARLPEAAKRIRKWVHDAEGDDLDLLLRALDLRVVASNESVVIEGSIPALEGTAKTGLPQCVSEPSASIPVPVWPERP